MILRGCDCAVAQNVLDHRIVRAPNVGQNLWPESMVRIYGQYEWLGLQALLANPIPASTPRI